MKLIKTIAVRTNAAAEFDQMVNDAIADGWTLIERKVLQPRTEDKYTMLYAELERFTEPDETEDSPLTNLIENLAALAGAWAEKAKPKEEPEEERPSKNSFVCSGCKHMGTLSGEEPCRSCFLIGSNREDREKEPEAHDCTNCKHREKSVRAEPCRNCDNNEAWEPKP